jgi:hypothetical protein
MGVFSPGCVGIPSGQENPRWGCRSLVLLHRTTKRAPKGAFCPAPRTPQAHGRIWAWPILISGLFSIFSLFCFSFFFFVQNLYFCLNLKIVHILNFVHNLKIIYISIFVQT